VRKTNKTQVGGSHYRTASGRQHWDVVEDHDIGYVVGCATKYLCRYERKNGRQDVEKALHFVDKVLELAEDPTHRVWSHGYVPDAEVLQFYADNQISDDLIKEAVLRLFQWRTLADLCAARTALKLWLRGDGI